MKKILKLVLPVGGLLVAGLILANSLNRSGNVLSVQDERQEQEASDQLSYHGRSGSDALSLLKENATIEQDASGLVSVINNRKADDNQHEYWGFYVNGELAIVGPADYQTQDTDVILWKIEKY